MRLGKKLLILALAGVMAAAPVAAGRIDVELSLGVGEILTTLIGLTPPLSSAEFGNQASSIDPLNTNEGAFQLHLPRVAVYFGGEHGAMADMDISHSVFSNGRGTNSFELFAGYSWRRKIVDRLIIEVSPGLLIHSEGMKTTAFRNSQTWAGLRTYVDLHYDIGSGLFVSAGLENNTVFAGNVSTQKTGERKTTTSYGCFQNSTTIPNLALGFAF